MKLPLLLAILILITPTACVNATSELRTTSDFCALAAPIHDHKNDTPRTRLQILTHNAKFACVCEGFCPENNGAGEHKALEGAADSL